VALAAGTPTGIEEHHGVGATGCDERRQAGAAVAIAYSITVTDTGDAAPAMSTGTPTPMPSRAASQQLHISWQAEDADGDRLVYALWFRGEGESDWKLLKTNMHENTFAVDGDALADGRYFFRVVASDREANPPASARDAELVSSPVLIDNTPPVVALSLIGQLYEVEEQFDREEWISKRWMLHLAAPLEIFAGRAGRGRRSSHGRRHRFPSARNSWCG
jgi:hypothetical protein